jgi:hypothetical protein
MTKFADLTGLTYGQLTPLRPVGRKNRIVYWACRCTCGKETTVSRANLRSGSITSCGCTRYQKVSEKLTLHGMTESSEYRIWCLLKTRCLNPDNPGYPSYGGRGIGVCARWQFSFENFLADMGPRPPRTSIDRIDVNGNYDPSNCRWADAKTQQRNRRNNHLVTAFGKTQCLSDWGDETGVPRRVISERLRKLGWSAERAITEASRGKPRT